ncbi:flavoprotein [Herbihabitans rhizosphaerae]|uniref:Flavoprotein n=1 Tax=Herbihabitans rhizosphaerae TaxID=1872711 RepID=A0A4Q7KBC2_9PSEU|nr:flavoprotein [Herbihabitans rhizosphaerae]RZS29816.1 flavoprotein [Herbihabitans rhizosphaerae]
MSTRLILGLVSSACYGVDTRLRRELAEPAAARGWRLAITLTPTATRWLSANGELDRLAELTDLPVRSEPRLPSEPKPYRTPDAFVFAPASANSVAKLALGIADNQALTALMEAVGAQGIPVVVRPQADPAQRGHPAWRRHLVTLREAGVYLDDGAPEDSWESSLDVVGSLVGGIG